MKTVLLLIVFVAQFQVFCSVDKAKIDSVNHQQRSIIVSNLQKSIKIFEQNVEDARSINYKYGEAASLFNLGVVTYLNGKYEESTEIFLKAINLFEELKLDRELALAYGEFGYQIKRRNLKKAIEYMRMGISIAGTNSNKTVGIYLPSDATAGTHSTSQWGDYRIVYNSNIGDNDPNLIYNANSGEIIITEFNKDAKYIKGTFAGIVTNGYNNTFAFTNGEFVGTY